MRSLMLVWAGVLALLAVDAAFATDVVLGWTPPVANDDGTTPAAFEGFNVYRVTALPIVTGGAPLAGKSPNGISATTLTYADKNVAPGTYYYGVTAWHCDAATSCTESVAAVSGAVVVKTTPKTAGVPGSITVTINGVAIPK